MAKALTIQVGIWKAETVEVILKRERGKWENNAAVNQTGVHCMHAWKCHDEGPDTIITYKKQLKILKKANIVLFACMLMFYYKYNSMAFLLYYNG
jgi:hypothetical protein